MTQHPAPTSTFTLPPELSGDYLEFFRVLPLSLEPDRVRGDEESVDITVRAAMTGHLGLLDIPHQRRVRPCKIFGAVSVTRHCGLP